MIFSTITMIFFFFPIILILYALLYKVTKGKILLPNLLLIVSSLVFYWWGSGLFTTVMLIMFIIINYFIAYIIRTQDSKVALILGIIFNIFVMIRYKYPVLLLQAIGAYMEGTTDLIKVVFPLGLSFIIFNSISYIVDVYKKKIDINMVNFSIYILFFPKLLQGPIVQYTDMHNELNERKFLFDNVCAGIERMIVGLAKKVLIADVFGGTVSKILSSGDIDFITSWLCVILISLQLYLDFSGYSDMAIGMAKVFGFSFKENFDFPYFSKSVSEFWRRWHISLGAWFREYIYFPLGGSKKGNVFINLFVVFLITGMWHGNTLIYIFWGVAHGLVVLFERTKIYIKLKEKIRFFSVIGWLYTFIVVSIGWLCFRLSGVSEFISYIKNLLGIGVDSVTFTWRYFLNNKIIALMVITVSLMIILYCKKVQEKIRKLNEESKIFVSIKYIVLIGIFFLCFTSIVNNGFSPFLYFSY